MKIIYVIAIILCCTILSVFAKGSLKMHRTPDIILPAHKAASLRHLNKYYSPEKNRMIGNSVILDGGVLTVGAYYAYISVGNPALNFSVLIDTGSSNIGIPGINCDSCGNTSVAYNPKNSTSALQVTCGSALCERCSPPSYFGNTSKCVFDQPICYDSSCAFGITYGGGSSGLFGEIWLDEVCFGGYCVKNHNFGVIQSQYPPDSFSSPPFDGIIGFAYEMNACNPTCTTPIYDDIVANYGLPNLFSMCLTLSNGGVMDLGLIDHSKYTGVIQYTPIETQRWYNIYVLDILVGDTSIGIPNFFMRTTNDVIGAFVDSGTSIILLAPLTLQYLQQVFITNYSNLPGVNNMTFLNGGCISAQEMGNKLPSFPPVSFVFKGMNEKNFTLPVPGSSYIFQAGTQYCFGIQGAIGIGIVLGDLFMVNYYIVFDRTNSRLGFAPLAAGSCV